MIFERLMKSFKSHKADIENRLLTNQIKDFNEYRYVTGRIRGLEDAIEIFKDFLNEGGKND